MPIVKIRYMVSLVHTEKNKVGDFVNLIIIQYIPINTMLFPCKQIEIAMYKQ